MPKNKGKTEKIRTFSVNLLLTYSFLLNNVGKGGKNRRRGKNENESEKRELVFKEDGQGICRYLTNINTDLCQFGVGLLTVSFTCCRIRTS